MDRTLLAALGLALAGCVTVPDDLAAPAEPTFAAESLRKALEAVLVDDHDHDDPAAHTPFLHNAREVARVAWSPSTDPAVYSYESFVLAERYLYQTLFYPHAGFVVFDVEDPVAPEFVAHYDAGGTAAAGLALSPDERWAFLATEVWSFAALFGATGYAQDQLAEVMSGGPAAADEVGIQIVDLADRMRPVRVGLYAAPPVGDGGTFGYHKVATAEIDGNLYVFGGMLAGGRVDIMRFEPEPTPHLVPVSAYQSDAARDPRNSWSVAFISQGDPDSAHTVHDIEVVPDPIEGFPLMTVSYWRGGVHLLDVSHPARPRLLGIWDEYPADGPRSVFMARATEIEGRRVIVAVPELFTAERQGAVWVVDATDSSAPALLGSWEIPGLHPFTSTFQWSTHNFVLTDGKVYVSYVHAGAYVLDIGTIERATAPEMVAAFVTPNPDPADWSALGVIDVMPNGRHLYVADAQLVVVELADVAAAVADG